MRVGVGRNSESGATPTLVPSPQGGGRPAGPNTHRTSPAVEQGPMDAATLAGRGNGPRRSPGKWWGGIWVRDCEGIAGQWWACAPSLPPSPSLALPTRGRVGFAARFCQGHPPSPLWGGLGRGWAKDTELEATSTPVPSPQGGGGDLLAGVQVPLARSESRPAATDRRETVSSPWVMSATARAVRPTASARAAL